MNPELSSNAIQQTGTDINAEPDSRRPYIEVDAAKHEYWPNWHELWEFRTVLWFLVIRDFKVRYKQTLLGAAWAVIQPATTMIVFTIFFGGVAQIKTPNGVPYPLFSFVALVPWTYFANGLSLASDSLLGQAHLVRKVYIPRLLIPIARILGGIIDYAIAFAVLIALMLIYGYWPPITAVVTVLLLSALATAATLGFSLWISALNTRYRDVRYVVPYALQVLLFASPIAYSSINIPEPLRSLYGLNPMATVIEGMRSVLVGTPDMSAAAYLLSVLVTLIFLLTGIWFFRRAEGSFADVM